MNKQFEQKQVIIKQDKTYTQGSKSENPEYNIDEMSAQIIIICNRLSTQNDIFSGETEEVALLIEDYILKYKRFLYSVISSHIFLSSDPGTIHSNIASLLNYVISKDYENSFLRRNPKKTNQLIDVQKSILKLLDHVNLAEKQYDVLKQTDEDYSTKFKKNIIPIKNDIDNQLATFSKDMTGQLISLIGIFTALSFILFGGISSLDNIYAGAKDIPLNKLLIVGTIWCFCIMNLVFVFMFFIAKLTHLDIRSSKEDSANLIQKYPLVFWCNHVLVCIISMGCWAYYIKCENLSLNVYNIIHDNDIAFFLVGTLFILVSKKFALLKKPMNPSRFQTHPAVAELFVLCVIPAVFLKA